MEQNEKKRSYWDKKIQNYFPNSFLDNMTDFNDSTCFTYYIASKNNEFKIGSQELNGYLEEGHDAYYIKFQISTIRPMVCVLFCKYEKSRTALVTSEQPYTEEQESFYKTIQQFIKENSLWMSNYTKLSQNVLFFNGQKQSAYQFYFEE